MDMKKKLVFLRSAAVVMAFCIGVAINYSCGDDAGSGAPVPNIPGQLPSNPTLNDLADAVRSLQSNVAALKSENETLKGQVATLTSKVVSLEEGQGGGNGGGGGNTGGEFEVDGLWFSRSGGVASKPKVIESASSRSEYAFDNKGRQSSTVIRSEGTNNNGYTTTYIYNYSGKGFTLTSTTVYDDGRDPVTGTPTVYEYY
jgi:hypothetical protein